MTNIKYLASFGCSWTYGNSCADIEVGSFRSLLAKKYNLDQISLGMPSSSLQSMQWQLVWWLKNTDLSIIKQTFVLVGLTGEDPTSWFNNQYKCDVSLPPWDKSIHNTMINPKEYNNIDFDAWGNIKKFHYVYSHCEELTQLNLDSASILFDSVGAKYNIPVLQFNTVATKKPTNIDTFYDIEMNDILLHEHFPPNDNHPNELGHAVIAEKLTEIIEANKLITYNSNS